jgi:peptidyl-dipeptidase Dcp
MVNVCNFPPPTDDKPSLLSMDEARTLFHEFGHGLHGLLSQVTYPSLSGTSVPRDFVELPSQIMENWCRDPKVIPMYARHYESGDTIPAELIERMKAAAFFDQGFATTEYLASSLIDMKYHNTPVEELPLDDIDAFERQYLRDMGMPDDIVARHRSTYFNHIFSGGYSAGYYSYIWSAILDADAYEAFVETDDLFNPEVAKAFRQHILSTGGAVDPQELYLRFRGAEPSPEPLLRRRGLKDEVTRP